MTHLRCLNNAFWRFVWFGAEKILLDAIEMNNPARITSYVLKFYSLDCKRENLDTSKAFYPLKIIYVAGKINGFEIKYSCTQLKVDSCKDRA